LSQILEEGKCQYVKERHVDQSLFKTLIRNKQHIACEKLWIVFGAGKHFRYIAAHELAAALSGDKAKSTRCLPRLYRM